MDVRPNAHHFSPDVNPFFEDGFCSVYIIILKFQRKSPRLGFQTDQ